MLSPMGRFHSSYGLLKFHCTYVYHIFLGISAVSPGLERVALHRLWSVGSSDAVSPGHHSQVLQGRPVCELCVLSCCGRTVIAVGWLAGRVDPWCWVPCWAAAAELVPRAAGLEAQPRLLQVCWYVGWPSGVRDDLDGHRRWLEQPAG